MTLPAVLACMSGMAKNRPVALDRDALEANLARAARAMAEARSHVVALQGIDVASSGSFVRIDHILYDPGRFDVVDVQVLDVPAPPADHRPFWLDSSEMRMLTIDDTRRTGAHCAYRWLRRSTPNISSARPPNSERSRTYLNRRESESRPMSSVAQILASILAVLLVVFGCGPSPNAGSEMVVTDTSADGPASAGDSAASSLAAVARNPAAAGSVAHDSAPARSVAPAGDSSAAGSVAPARGSAASRPTAVAAETRASRSGPVDVSADFREERLRMVRRQIEGRGIDDRAVLEAMRTVPRHRFVSEAQADQAYADRPLPIGHGQTISQPYIVAYMSELVSPDSADRVLEVGTGSGYQAAVLAEIVGAVYTIEIIPELARTAESRLDEFAYRNVHVRNADGYYGWDEHAPFDAVVVTAAAEHIPPPLIEQLADGGRMVIPVGSPFRTQMLMLVEKDGEDVSTRSLTPVRFVPFTRSD